MAVVLDFILPWTQEVATSGQTVFSTVWTADVASDVVVYARTAAQDPDDVTQLVSPNDYNVAFIGVGLTVQVTFLAGRTVGDIITITRDTPADRLNLFINTNFTPSMLNGQFGRLVMMIQQNDLYNLDFAPHYNISATPTAPDRIADIILPILPAGYGWRKNAANTAIEAVQTVTIPVGTIAPFTDDNRMVRTKIAGPENTIEQIDVEITDANVIQSTAGDLGLDAAGNLLFKGIAFPNAGAAPNKILALLDATHMEWVDFGGLFAYIDLSNLAATAVNVDLNPDANGTIDFGSPNFRWKDTYALTANTGETGGNTYKLRAWNTNTMAFVDFLTLTAGNPPTGVLNGDITTTTQAALDNSQRIATTAYVDAATGGGAGANVHLSNLTGVAINTTLVSDTDDLDDLGTGLLRWRRLYASNAGTGTVDTDTFKLQGWNTNTLAFVDFLTITAGNPPTAQLAAAVTGATQAAGTADATLATTLFVSTAIANATTGLDFKDPAYAATTAALNTTYANGAAGVGATLTANVNGAFATDSVSPPLNARILVKNQAVSAENGIYILNDQGSAGTPYQLTRSVDYDNVAEIDPGTFILVDNGTTLAGSAWIQTATVAIIGTDPITWSRFGQNLTLPLSLANGGTNKALVADAGGIVWCDADSLEILAHTTTANQVLLSGNAATPAWSTATYPATVTVNRLLWASATNVISDLATANSGILVTSGAGVPSIGTALPNGITATTQAANDNSTKVATTAYADAIAASGGPWVKLSQQTAAASATVNFDNLLSATYDYYKVIFENVQPATNAVTMEFQIGTGATPTYQTTNYAGIITGGTSGGYFAIATSASFGQLGLTNRNSNDANNVMGGELLITNANGSTYKSFTGQNAYYDTGTPQYNPCVKSINWQSATVITSIRFLASSGNITKGTYTLYGLVK